MYEFMKKKKIMPWCNIPIDAMLKMQSQGHCKSKTQDDNLSNQIAGRAAGHVCLNFDRDMLALIPRHWEPM